jgi:co-chaperonin GroES (HSP10)
MNNIPIRVVGPRVLIKPDIEEQKPEQTASGLYLAKTLEAAATGEDAREAWYTGVVVAFGEERPAFDVRPYVKRRLNEALDATSYLDLATDIAALYIDLDTLPTDRARDVSVGDHVTFSARAGQELDIDGDSYLIMNETDILGVLETA